MQRPLAPVNRSGQPCRAQVGQINAPGKAAKTDWNFVEENAAYSSFHFIDSRQRQLTGFGSE
jgi:hypothetical protein